MFTRSGFKTVLSITRQTKCVPVIIIESTYLTSTSSPLLFFTFCLRFNPLIINTYNMFGQSNQNTKTSNTEHNIYSPMQCHQEQSNSSRSMPERQCNDEASKKLYIENTMVQWVYFDVLSLRCDAKERHTERTRKVSTVEDASGP